MFGRLFKSNTRANKAPPSCVFCDIAHQVASNADADASTVVCRNDEFYILRDIAPATETHLLAIPLRHIADVNALQATDVELLHRMQTKLCEVLAQMGYNVAAEADEVRLGFHVPPFISVPHLHMHGLAPVAKLHMLGKLKFRHNNVVFCTVQHAIDRIAGRQKL